MISAVVLTHNDQLTSERALNSLAWCDEIIVIDDQSTDQTVAIAKKFGAHIYERALSDDFASQRNFGLEKTNHDWVLFVDSDEMVSKELSEEIQRVISVIPAREPGSARNDNDFVGYFFKRADSLWGRVLKHGETNRVRLLRLAQKDAGKWVRPVHEVWDVKGLVGELREPLLHFPHPNVAQFIEEINFYSTINAHYLFNQKIRAHGWHIIAYPLAKFFLNYVWYLGFLDGTAGAVVAFMMSFHSFLTRAKLWLLWHKKP